MSPVLKAPSATVPTVECPHRRMFASGRHRAPGGVPPDIRWPAQWTYVSSSPFHQEKEKRKKKKKELEIQLGLWMFSSSIYFKEVGSK